MTVFLDTSAVYAMLDADDDNHEMAERVWKQLIQSEATLVTHSYVLVETAALLQHRLGVAALRVFHEDIMPMLQVDWVTASRHFAAVEAVLTAARRKLSLVDCVSFQTMRECGAHAAFAFDDHYREQGFRTLR